MDYTASPVRCVSDGLKGIFAKVSICVMLGLDPSIFLFQKKFISKEIIDTRVKPEYDAEFF